MISLHTSPLDQPGTGDAGGMNVYVVELSSASPPADIEVEIFTRATSSHAAADRRGRRPACSCTTSPPARSRG